jgi:hypothetical protein
VKEKERRGRWEAGPPGGFGPDDGVGRWRKAGQRAERKRGRERVRSFSFFFNLFKSFSNFKLFSKFKHLKPFASFQIILKTFKTSHPHT